MTVASHHSARDLIERINPFLPAGVKIVSCKLNPPKKQSSNKLKIDRYRVVLFDANVDSVRIDEFKDSDQWDYTRIRHKGRAQHFDLKSVVTQLDEIDKKTVEIGIRAEIKPIARPADILRSVFELVEPSIQGARIRKLK
jgi:hypothetical protein